MNTIPKRPFILGLMLAVAAVHAEPGKSTRCDGMSEANPAAKQEIKAAGSPVVSNVEYIQVPGPGGSTQVVVTYDLSAAANCTVSLQVSDDGGAHFDIQPQTLSGAVGAGVSPGAGRQILWNIGADLPGVAIDDAVIRVVADDNTCTGCLNWSDPAMWGGSKPVAGQNVTIPSGWHVILDEDTPELGGLTIEGTLDFARQDLHLSAEWIMLHGELRIGTEYVPFAQSATITLTDTDIGHSVMGMGTRGIMVMGGGLLNLHGTPPALHYTKIDEHAAAGATTLTILDPVTWNPGDEIIVAPTDFYGVAETERRTISTVAGSELQIDSGLDASRWGRLQYVTSTGMSLTPGEPPALTPEMEGIPLVLDQRATVANLTRNIVIEAPDDTAWQTNGFGVHIMVMGSGSQAFLNGVEIRRGGQQNRLGRYPFHWHMLSYAPPLEIGDATGQYIRNSVINQSMNRGIVVHGTNGVLVQDNVVYDTRGHGIFTEDAVERRNTFEGNVVMRVRNPADGMALKLHETELGSPGVAAGSSGFWISNPDNRIVNNIAADCQAFGFWLAFTFRAWGESGLTDETRVPMNPQRIALDEFSNNTAHSHRFRGVMLDMSEGNAEGRVAIPQSSQQYIPTPSPNGLGELADYANRIPFEITRLSLWKNGHNGIWDRASGPKNRLIVSADNCQKFFAGSGEQGLIERCLVIGNSLNSASPRPLFSGDPTPSGFATYHSAFDIQNNLIVNMPLEPGKTSGVFAEDDFYFRPVEKGMVRNTGNVFINSHPGYKSVAYLGGTGSYAPFASWFNLAPAKWDPVGYYGTAGNFLVYDTPFMTWGIPAEQVAPVAPGVAQTGALSVPGPFYGFTAFTLHGHNDTFSPAPWNHDFEDLMEIYVRRLNPANPAEVVGDWRVAGIGDPDELLAHMRDFAAHRDGLYDLEFPFNQYNPGWSAGLQHPTRIRMEVENLLDESDTLTIGVHFDGTLPAQVVLVANGHQTTYSSTGMNSRADVWNSAGETFWQDTTNNRVWIKLRGGRWQPGDPSWFEFTPDTLLYETTYLYIVP